jgi:hypothetical protein
LSRLVQEARAYKRSAYAESTKSTYRSQMKAYLEFCIRYSCVPVPASQSTLVGYLAYLAKKLSAASIPGYMNVVRLLHMEAGLVNPLAGNWELDLIKRGIRRQLGKPPKQKLPITLDLLRVMYGSLNLSDPQEVSFWAAMLIGFFGFLRKSTLMPSGSTTVPGRFIARLDVVNMTLESFELCVRFSKVIQFGQRVLVLPFFHVRDVRLCPLRALLHHLGLSVLQLDRPLFNFVRAGAECAFVHAGFVGLLKKVLGRMGVDHRLYSAHSLRRGGASFAFFGWVVSYSN